MKTRTLIITALSFLTAFVLFGDSDGFRNEPEMTASQFILSSDTCGISAPVSELNLPRPTNFINSQRSYSNARRTNNAGASYGTAFVKAGKIHKVYSKDFQKLSPDMLPMGHMVSKDHLTGLGKLLI